MSDYTRDREGFRFQFSGMKTSARADALPFGKYPLAVNVRSYSDGTIQTRPGIQQLFKSTSGASFFPFTDLRAYEALFNPTARFLAIDTNGAVWLDNGISVGSLPVNPLGSMVGASMIPFRPNASPTPWMYIANGTEYQKFSAPSVTNAVVQQKVGIAEPQTAPDAVPNNWHANYVLTSSSFANSGTAGSVSTGARSSENVVAAFQDPIAAGTCCTIQVGGSVQYQIGQLLTINAFATYNFVRDVFQPLPANISILGIYYFSGTTGHCIIVPNTSSPATGSSEESIYTQYVLSNLRRGALVSIGGEVCYVWSVTDGPNGQISFETSTVNNHATTDMISGVPAFQIQLAAAQPVPTAGQAILSDYWSTNVTTGVGLVNTTVANLFTLANASFQEDDYIHLSVLVDVLANLTEIKIIFDVNNGSADFVSNAFYYTIRPNDIVGGIANTLTQLGVAQIVSQRALVDEEVAAEAGNQANTASSAQTATGNSQWSEIKFPISALTRIGNDQSRTINNTQAVRILINCSGNVFVEFSSISIQGQFQPDVGDAGAPYMYRVRPRSSLTGVVGNPSPPTRYGVSPRRESVLVTLPSAAYDGQIDTWDIFRYGGSVTSWRFIGSTPSTNSSFEDNYDDAAAEAGDSLDFDNFEPWPSVDVPNTGVLSVKGAVGTVVDVFTADTDIVNYLPGTLIQIGGGNVYTFYTRPIPLGAGSYRIQLVENAGTAAFGTAYIIQEPIIANQMLPYMWGPDASGTVFACGDGFRPGTLYFSKDYVPDSAPDTFNQEISPPSEPLLGGETIDGLAFVASPERWWALYPQPQDVRQRYSVVQQPFTRGLAAPFGHCNDGQTLYWWAKDGIYSSTKGSLTDDLYNIFPHEGIDGENVTYNGVTAFAPDYTRANTFRLTYSLGFLYAIYQDTTGTYRMLTLDVKRMAWCVDQYPSPVTAAYHLEQTPQASSAVTLFASFVGPPATNQFALVAQQKQLTNDLGNPVVCTIATNEFDGGDVRAPKQWGDFFVDCLPVAPSGVSVQPMSIGAGVTPATVVPTSGSRTRVPISTSFGNPAVSDFMGLMLQWQDDYTKQSQQTRLFLWQPSYLVQPARTVAWDTLGSAFGSDGYKHIRQIAVAYISTAEVILSPVSYDGMSPVPITLPSTNGNYRKTLFPVSANKGQLFQFITFSPNGSPFQIFAEDSDIYVGPWGRNGPYQILKKFGGALVAPSPI